MNLFQECHLVSVKRHKFSGDIGLDGQQCSTVLNKTTTAATAQYQYKILKIRVLNPSSIKS